MKRVIVPAALAELHDAAAFYTHQSRRPAIGMDATSLAPQPPNPAFLPRFALRRPLNYCSGR